MSDIFISYKTEDRKRVAHLVAALRGEGLDVWWDQDIPAGGGWRDTIEAQLDKAKLCVVAWTEESTGPRGRFVREEAERTAGRGAYLGVLIDPVQLPFGFAEWQSIDLSEWNGKAKHPLLAHFVAQVRATLEGVPVKTEGGGHVAGGRRRRRSANWPLFGAAALILLAGAGFLVWRMLPGAAAAESPTAFVNARLNRSACSWLQIVNVTPAQGGERVALAGVAASPTAVQAGLMRRAMDASVPLAELDVSQVATGPNETCAQLELLRQYRWNGRSRLTIVPPRGPMRHTQYGWAADFEFDVDMQGLPEHAALLGLDSVGGLEVLVPDLAAFRRQQPPLRTTGTRIGYRSTFFDERQNARNVGLILMTSSAPIDVALVNSIGRSGDRAALARIENAARDQQWQFELALVRCGFEGGEARRC